MLEVFLDKKVLYPILTVVICYIVYITIKILIKQSFMKNAKKHSLHARKAITIVKLLQNLLKYTMFIIIILTLLSQNGVNVKTIVAGLGAVGLVIGLAFQDIIKDFLAGIFIIIDNQFWVGEIIQVGTFKGEVVELGLKSTRLKNSLGEVRYIANRNILEVINYSISESLAIVDLNVSYDIKEEDLRKIFDEIDVDMKKLSDVTGKIVHHGIQKLDAATYMYRVAVPCKPVKKTNVERELLRRIKDYFIENNLTMPSSKEVS